MYFEMFISSNSTDDTRLDSYVGFYLLGKLPTGRYYLYQIMGYYLLGKLLTNI